MSRLLMGLYPGTTPLYWAFLGLNLSSQIGYLVRDSYRNETVIPHHRYIDYAMKGFIGALITTFAYEITHRLEEAFYMAPATAKQAYQMDTELAKTFRDPVTKTVNSSAKNVTSLTKVPSLLKRMSGSFAKKAANPELADNLLHELRFKPDTIPAEERPAVLQFWKRTRFWQAADENTNKVYDDYLKLIVDNDPEKHDKELLKYFKPGIKQLPTSQLNVLRDTLLQHQLVMKTIKDIHTENKETRVQKLLKPIGKALKGLFGKAKEKPSQSSLNREDKIRLFSKIDLDKWLDKEIELSRKFDSSLTLDKSAVPNHNWLGSSKSDLSKLDKYLKDTIFSSFNYVEEATINGAGENGSDVKRKIFNPFLADNKIKNIRETLAMVKQELNNGVITDFRQLKLVKGADTRIKETLHKQLAATGADKDSLIALKELLTEGLKSFDTKKTLSVLDKHNFWLKMAAVIGIQFFSYGLFTTFLDVKVAQPLQKRLTAEGIRPDKVARWPIYTALIPGALSFIVMSSNKLFGALPGVNKISRLGRIIISSLVSGGSMAAWMIGGINKNINEQQTQALAKHNAHRKLPDGFQEENLIQLGYEQFSKATVLTRSTDTTDTPQFSKQAQQQNPFALQ